jgi:pyruvate dehydrogenase E2 component (dihydrolipoamide acetyltransferase)
MAVEVVMPALALGRETCRLVRWLRREGDLVSRGEPLMEVEAEKAIVEVEAPGSGVLSGIRVREGEQVPVGMVVAYLLAPAPRPAATGRWRTMAESVARSWRETPHLYLFREVDASQLLVARAGHAGDVTQTDLLVRLVALTLALHPAMNSGHDEINVAVTVAADDAALLPVIHGADRLEVPAVAARRAELVARWRAGGLREEDLAGATFTVTDLGAYGVDALLPTVTEGQAGALGVGRVADAVRPVQGRPQVRPVLTMTLSCDQRAVDGARAAAFLRDLAEALEEPASLL